METNSSSHEAMEPVLMSWKLVLKNKLPLPADRKKKQRERWKVQSSNAKQVKTGTSEDLCEIRDVPVSALKHCQ